MGHGVGALIVDPAFPLVDYTVCQDPFQVEKARAANPNQTLKIDKYRVNQHLYYFQRFILSLTSI